MANHQGSAHRLSESGTHAAPPAPTAAPRASDEGALARAGSAAINRILADDGLAHGKKSGVELCRRPAEVPLLGELVDHWWLRGGGFEAGMGARGEGAPGDAGHVRPKTLHTTINDHSGRGSRSGSVCTPVEDLSSRWAYTDAACVRERMTVGRETGLWAPPFNDCHDVATEALDGCARPPTSAPMGGGPRDAGVDER